MATSEITYQNNITNNNTTNVLKLKFKIIQLYWNYQIKNKKNTSNIHGNTFNFDKISQIKQ